MPVYQPLRERYIASAASASPDLHYAQSKGLDIQEVPRTNPNAPRELIPYLYLAPCPSAPTTPSTLLPAPVDRPWTHVVRLLPSTKAHPVGSAELIPPSRAGPNILDIRVPAEAFVCTDMKTKATRKQETTRMRKPLHEYLPAQSLLVARDFLALALPYYASAHPLPSPSFASAACGGWPMSSTGGWTPTTSDSDSDSSSSSSSSTISSPIQADPVAVLLVGPPQLTLALALVYIAYASGRAVRDVVRGILESESEAAEEWVVQGMIAGDGLSDAEMRLLEEAAMSDF
ncbi:hypothetical protein C8F01DRAFT_1106107 [Mycena amicta]|nr:hypothetical protein C8F01DRAFT_1106107 [Mycena amicta]